MLLAIMIKFEKIFVKVWIQQIQIYFRKKICVKTKQAIGIME
jgi:hypothetical protein